MSIPLHVIEVDPADTYHSLRHRLLWHGRERAVLLLPGRATPIRRIDLLLLRRLADSERLDIGLVTTDRDTARHARALGWPVFANLTLAEHYRPGWWRIGRRALSVGFAPGESYRRPPPRAATPAPTSIHALRVLVFLLMAVLLLGVLGLAAVITIPTASLRIRPQPLPVQVIAGFTADPSLSFVVDQSVPARLVSLDQPWEAVGSTTDDAAEDVNRIATNARQGLAAAAPERLAARLEPGELLVPSSIRAEVVDQAFEPSGETATLSLSARLEGLAVREADLLPAVLRQLSAALAAGYAADPASVQLLIEPNATAPGDTFQVKATAIGRAAIDPAALAELLRGQRAADAARYLSAAYQLAEPPTIDVRPSWWWSESRGRLPYRADRIRIDVLP